MLSRESATREALAELEAQRTRNYEEEQRRRDALAEKSPQAAALLEARRSMLADGMRRAFASPQDAERISGELTRAMEETNAALHRELKALGLPEDWLQPIHSCAVCGDTGYVGEPVREQCACLKRRVLDRLCREEGLQGLAEQNFERFREEVFPDDPIEGLKNTQRGYMRLIRERCEQYADTFRPGEGKGLLFYGETGVGKTYMMNCVAQRVLARGYSVVFVSAYKLAEIMREYQFDGSSAGLVTDMLGCDLLCVDDLGSEPLRRETTVSGLYHIVSERMNAGRAIALTSNCSAAQLYERYGDRIAARLCDPGRMQVIRFPGADVRRRAAALS